MRIWRHPMLFALVAFNMAVEGFVYERQQPVVPSITAQPSSSSSTPVVVSTIFLQDPRPRPTDATAVSSPQTQDSNAQPIQTSTASSAAVAGLLSISQGDVVPAVMPDAPVTAFFLVLFLGLTAGYMKIMSKNRHLRPTLSAVVLTFCILRVAACGLRIAWALVPDNEAYRISEMISLNVGSVVIFMASAVIAKRMVRQFALTALTGSNWRFTLWWLAKLLLIVGSVSSIGIIVLPSVGTSQLANVLVPSGILKDNPTLAQMLVMAGIAWLFALGALYMLSVAVVVISTRNLSRRYEKLGLKLAVFYATAVLLEIGQGFRLYPNMSRAVFYTTGFTLEILAVSLYALMDLDRLFSDEHIDSTLARYRKRRRSSSTTSPFDFFGNDVHAITRGAQRPTTERTDWGGITIRKSLYVSVDRSSTVPFFPGHDARRPLSIVSEHSEVSISSSLTSEYSELNFPFPAPHRPKRVRRKPVPTAPPPQLPQDEPVIQRAPSTASRVSFVPGRGKVPAFTRLSAYKELSPYAQPSPSQQPSAYAQSPLAPQEWMAKAQSAETRQPAQQNRRYRKEPEVSVDEEDLY
ncbi:hypothetical protein N0V82_009417 [Gnomoniopsis sp. IMI 355080]|nr:hypothetical protein N0V82_009417 [Gnomoniopsis sp. IMI 355080]